jgi:putative ABC transport system permease protein
VQFAASISLIICAMVILRQLRYIRSTDLGYDRDHVLVLRLRGADQRKSSLLKETMLQQPNVVGGSASMHLPIDITSSTRIEGKNNRGEPVLIRTYQLYADYDFLNVYRIPLEQGRSFSPGVASDSNTTALVNETFVKAFGWKDPVGKTFQRSGKNVTIIGVVRDFHMHSLHEPIEPLFIRPLRTTGGQYLALRVRPTDIPSTIASLKASWNEISGGYPFEYSFLDENLDAMYRSEERLSQTVSSFTFLALLVASLGLFGLAAFITQQRRKEIAVRRVFGAHVSSIVALLSREFLALVGLANLIAWPLAYVLMHSWLQDFAYRIPLGIGFFLLAAAVAVTLASLTVSYQSIKAAVANPGEALRYE